MYRLVPLCGAGHGAGQPTLQRDPSSLVAPLLMSAAGDHRVSGSPTINQAPQHNLVRQSLLN